MRNDRPLGRALARVGAVAPSILLSLACGKAPADEASAVLPLRTVERELSIGSVDDPAYAFGPVTGLEVGAGGEIFSLHAQEALIRRWTAEGEPAGTLGGRGDGPGEFRSPRTIGRLADTLWIGDTYRFTLFGPDGAYLRTSTPRWELDSRGPGGEPVLPARPERLFQDGTLYGVTPGFSDLVLQGELTRRAHVRLEPNGATLDTLVVTPVAASSVLGVRFEGGAIYGVQPYADDVLVGLASAPPGLLVLERDAVRAEGPAAYRLTRIGLGGDTVFSRAYAYEPVAVPPERLDSLVAAEASDFHEAVGERTGTTLAWWRERVREAVYAPPFHPPVRGLAGGRDGTIWIELAPAGPEGSEWLVLDPDGEPRERILVPPDLRVLQADREHVWGIERDRLDVDYIVRYRVVRP